MEHPISKKIRDYTNHKKLFIKSPSWVCLSFILTSRITFRRLTPNLTGGIAQSSLLN